MLSSPLTNESYRSFQPWFVSGSFHYEMFLEKQWSPSVSWFAPFYWISPPSPANHERRIWTEISYQILCLNICYVFYISRNKIELAIIWHITVRANFNLFDGAYMPLYAADLLVINCWESRTLVWINLIGYILSVGLLKILSVHFVTIFVWPKMLISHDLSLR